MDLMKRAEFWEDICKALKELKSLPKQLRARTETKHENESAKLKRKTLLGSHLLPNSRCPSRYLVH